MISGADCSKPDCPGEPNCNNQGHCNTTFDPPICTDCDAGWMGPACGDVCLHGTPNHNHSECICSADCYHGLGCDIECSEHGTCNATGGCYCPPLSGWRGEYCEYPGIIN